MSVCVGVCVSVCVCVCVCVCAGQCTCVCCEIKQSNPKGMKHLLSFIPPSLFLFFATLKDNVMLLESRKREGRKRKKKKTGEIKGN